MVGGTGLYIRVLAEGLFREPPFDPSRKVLDQRGYWFANEIYDKPVLATEPMHWKPGFHRTEDGRMRLRLRLPVNDR